MPMSRTIIPLCTAVPCDWMALPSIWQVEEALHLKRTFTITCLLQAWFSLLKTKSTLAADFTSQSTENLQITPCK